MDAAHVQAVSLHSYIKKRFETVKCNPENFADPAAEVTLRDYGLLMDIMTAKAYEEITEIFGDVISLTSISIEEKVLQDIKPDVLEVEEEIPVQIPIQPEISSQAVTAPAPSAAIPKSPAMEEAGEAAKKTTPTQHVISVNLNKLDKLLKLMGEIVIAEAMVTQNTELDGLKLDNFQKEARQLRLILKELQDTVMSMRMVPLSTTFFKMNRIVRDMCKQLNKEVQLDIVGEETEVDRNIIEHINDPIMHIIRNSVDHGIEMPDERVKAGKPEKGRVLLEAKNSGSDILIIIKDDGKGLNRDRIMSKAKKNGLLYKPEHDYTDKEVHQFIFMAGFSTNEVVTNFSGRGVGMDVVMKNLEQVDGQVIVDSVMGEGSTFTLKIPLTLAIIDGMVVTMGGAKYIIPIMAMKTTFRPKLKDVFYDPNGNEMITVHGDVYNVVRLYEAFGLPTETTELEDGIMVMLEDGDNMVCLFLDDLIAEQPIVVKEIPKYIKKPKGISGCTLLGNGEISLIIDIAGFFDK
jgi:two-component system chemotaxis sensor kinase CheA